jgi:hypothetical protein
MAEDLLNNLLEHVVDLIDQISRLRRQLDVQKSLQTNISSDFAVKHADCGNARTDGLTICMQCH